jgi:hypothetical protein
MTMSQLHRINVAIARLRPTLAQIQLRRPRGFTRQETDSLAIHLKVALDHLEIAASMYEEPAVAGTSRFAGGAR